VARDSPPSPRIGVLAEIERSIAEGRFELYYQPVAAIGDGHIEALEALVRWNHPREGLLPPSLFLPNVEQSSLAWPFTRHVLERAARQIREWMGAGQRCQVAVNVSAHLVNRRLVSELEELLQETGIPARVLALEVTESAVMQDPISATRALDRLAALGIGGIAIDDFGTGHSSLARLRDLPIDALKIDRSFIAELHGSADPAFVRAVIDLAHYLSLRVVAEGVEHEETWGSLARLGCDSGQGFWLSPPMPADEVPQWLAQHDPEALAGVGAVSERRLGPGRRALDRIAGAFDRAPEAMLLSDYGHRWVAVNAAARSLLQAGASSLLDRHVDETTRPHDGPELSRLLHSLADQPQRSGTCDLIVGDGLRQRVRYELRRTMIPDHHVWVLAAIEASPDASRPTAGEGSRAARRLE
jgi:EAL domain-containing protein (putative c-di-GMP-specific phosphodiesterase class I)